MVSVGNMNFGEDVNIPFLILNVIVKKKAQTLLHSLKGAFALFFRPKPDICDILRILLRFLCCLIF